MVEAVATLRISEEEVKTGNLPLILTRETFFEKVFAPNEREFLRHASNIRVRGRFDPEDRVQEAALKALVSIGEEGKEFSGIKGAATWFHTIIEHLGVDDLRRSRSIKWESLPSDNVRSRTSWVNEENRRKGVDPEAYALETERYAITRKVLKRLSAPNRRILLMFHIEDMSYEQMANQLGTTVSAVRSRLNRAREALKKVVASMDPKELS